MRVYFAFAALLLNFTGNPAQACEKSGNVMQSPLALPTDNSLNMQNMGGAFVIAPDDCAEPLYRMIFPRKLAAAEDEDVTAMDAVGLMYAAGAGIKQDWGAAQTWLQRAATAGSASAHYRLAVMFQFGHGLDTNLPRAIDHYRAASEKGLAWASTNLGVMSLNGLGMNPSPIEAARLFELGRQQGDPEASANLAVMHAQGMIGREADYGKSFELAKEAASGGSISAMRLVGYSYANALGTQQDLESAYVWASFAAQHGDALGEQLSDKIAPALPSEALKRAKRRLKLCADKGPQSCV